MAMKSNNGSRFHKEHMADINITPMVDVMLVLLVIFMVAAPMMTSGVTVDLPKTAASPIAGNDEPLTVSVRPNGKVFLQESEVSVKELAAKLGAIAGEKKREEMRIFVKGDQTVDYGRIMQVVTEINMAGFVKVALLTDPSGGAPRTR